MENSLKKQRRTKPDQNTEEIFPFYIAGNEWVSNFKSTLHIKFQQLYDNKTKKLDDLINLNLKDLPENLKFLITDKKLDFPIMGKTDKIIDYIRENITNKNIQELLTNYSDVLTYTSIEGNVDNFVKGLLIEMEFFDFKRGLKVKTHHPLGFQIPTLDGKHFQNTPANPDVVVLTLDNIPCLLVVEDKAEENKKGDPEAQAIAEMLAAYHEYYINEKSIKFNNKNYDFITDYSFPFIVVKGTVFTFYFVSKMKRDIIESINYHKISPENLLIYRICEYVNPKTDDATGFDFKIFEERLIIFKCLLFFRKIIYDSIELFNLNKN